MCAESDHLGAGASQSGHRQFTHRQIDEGLAARMGTLEITGKPTVVSDPGIRTFHYPSSGRDIKAFGHDLVPVDLCSFRCPHPANTGPRMIDDLKANPEELFHPLSER